MNVSEELRRLVAARLGVPWRSVRVAVRSRYRLRSCRRYGVARFCVVVATVGGRVLDLGAFGSRPRWMLARAALYARAGATTPEEFDAIDAEHPPLHGRIGRMTRHGDVAPAEVLAEVLAEALAAKGEDHG